jgi:four helix bundle protein
MKIRSYRDLIVWQRGMDLIVLSYKIAKRLPSFEKFGLASQIRRAAVSIPANIAEGHGRQHRAEYVHHLSFANGSLMELETELVAATRLDYVAGSDIQPALQTAAEVGRMLASLIRKLRT